MGLWRGESSVKRWQSPGASSHATNSSVESESSCLSHISAHGDDYQGERNAAGEREGWGLERWANGDTYEGAQMHGDT